MAKWEGTGQAEAPSDSPGTLKFSTYLAIDQMAMNYLQVLPHSLAQALVDEEAQVPRTSVAQVCSLYLPWKP